MKIIARKISLVFVVLFVGLLAVSAFLQFSHASASGIEAVKPAEPKTTPEQANSPSDIGYWVVSANISDASLNVIHTTDDTVYGPFLEGQLGPKGGGLLDIAMLPNRPVALISNFGGSVIHFVDFSNPISPSWMVSVTVPMFAEDIDLTRDGRYALVTDGGLSNLVAVVDTHAMTTVYTLSLGTKDAQAVEIAPDGTAVLVDYMGGEIHTLVVEDTGEITITNSYSNLLPSASGSITVPTPGGLITYTKGWPVNIGIAPDGQTVIVCNAFTTTLNVFRILAPGVLTHTGYVTGLLGSYQPPDPDYGPGTQSIAFNNTGDKAYVTINGRVNISPAVPLEDQIAILNIDGPGQVSLNLAEAANIPRYTSGQFFGVDTLALANGKAYIGHPTSFAITETNDLAVVDLFTFDVYTLTVGKNRGDLPTGVAVISDNKIYLPLVNR